MYHYSQSLSICLPCYLEIMRRNHSPVCLHTRQINLNSSVSEIGSSIWWSVALIWRLWNNSSMFSGACRCPLSFTLYLYYSIAFHFFFCFCLLACCCSHNFLWIKHSIFSQLHLLTSLLYASFCLSPGFYGVPEDLLPDFDLKIMPGRGVIFSHPDLVPSNCTNPAHCSNMCRNY